MSATIACLSTRVCKLEKGQGQESLLEASPSTNFLRLAATVAEGETVTIDGNVFEVDTDGLVANQNIPIDLSASAATAASSTLTSTGVLPTIGDTVTIGSTVYTLKDTLTAAYNVARGANAAASLANLKKAINATGVAGTDYFAGTLIHPTVTAGTLTATTLLYTAKIKGTVGNAIATTDTAATLSTTGGTLAGGVNATAAQMATAFALAVNTSGVTGVTAPYSSATSVVIADSKGRLLATTETLAGANNAWNTAALTGSTPVSERETVMSTRIATAADVTVGIMVFPFNFAPTSATAQVRTTAGVFKAWDGVLAISGNVVTVDNAGSTDWAATDKVIVTAQ